MSKQLMGEPIGCLVQLAIGRLQRARRNCDFLTGNVSTARSNAVTNDSLNWPLAGFDFSIRVTEFGGLVTRISFPPRPEPSARQCTLSGSPPCGQIASPHAEHAEMPSRAQDEFRELAISNGSVLIDQGDRAGLRAAMPEYRLDDVHGRASGMR